MTARGKILAQVSEERDNQLAKWGEQHHPDGTGSPEQQFQADWDRQVCKQADELGRLTWADILQEEVSEAFAEGDAAKLRAELVQVAAVAAAWIEDIDSRDSAVVQAESTFNPAGPAEQIHWGIDYIERNYGGDHA